MKKMLITLLVLAMVAPALAEVAVTATDEGSGHLKIKVSPTNGAVVRGVALKLTNANGAVIDSLPADVTATNFNTFIDYAFSNAGYVIGTGHAAANSAAAGVATVPTGNFSLCAGYLDQDADATLGEGLIVDSFFDVFFTLSGDATINIALDTLRGGIVGDTLGAVTVQASQVLIGAIPECIPATNASYAQWTVVGKPDSWCNVRQCYGDATASTEVIGKGTYWVGYNDLNIFLTGFKATYVSPAASPWIAADFTRSTEVIGKGTYRVGYNDLNIFLANFKSTTVPTTCNN